MKSAPALSCCIALVVATVGIAGPAFAETQLLDYCKEDYYPNEVYELWIDISASARIQDGFDLELALGGSTLTESTVEKREDKGRKWWEGRSSKGFYIKKTDIRPKVPGFFISGPESCRYQVIPRVEVPTEKICIARYSFRAYQEIELQVNPPESVLRIGGHTRSPKPDKRCPRNPDDEKLAAEIRAELEKAGVLRSFAVEVSVRQGIVHLAGRVNGNAAKLALAAAQRKVKDKRKVKDNLQVSSLSGTSLIDAGGAELIVAIEIDGEPRFTTPLVIDWEMVMGSGWEIKSKILEAYEQQLDEAEETKGADRTRQLRDAQAPLARKIATKLESITSITIKRSNW